MLISHVDGTWFVITEFFSSVIGVHISGYDLAFMGNELQVACNKINKRVLGGFAGCFLSGR
jgi:hypothetical protein